MRWLSLDEVADVLRVPADLIERVLDAVPATLPGAMRSVAGGWIVPERALRAVLGAPTGPLPAMATVDEVAACVRKDVKTIYRWLKLLHADNKPVLPHKRVMGTILVPAAAVLELPRRAPGPPPSFFSQKRRVEA